MNKPRPLHAGMFLLTALGLIGSVPEGRGQPLTHDLVWRHTSQGYDGFWIMNGINLSTATLLSPDPVSDLNWKIVGAADFSKDGHPDLVWWHQTTGQIKVWFMNGQNRTAEAPFGIASVPTNWRIVGVADFNQDKKPDLLWQDVSNYQIVIWYMNGLNVITTTPTTPDNPGTGWRVIGTGDFNVDGRPDLVFQHQSTAEVAIWHMKGHTRLSATLTTPTGPGTLDWRLMAVGDMNGDLKPDLIWQYVDSMVGVWYMDGAAVTSPIYLNPSYPSHIDWRIVATGVFNLASVDSDNDFLPDNWEIQHFGNLNQSYADDADGDGWNNWQEFSNHTHPNLAELKITMGNPRPQSRIP